MVKKQTNRQLTHCEAECIKGLICQVPPWALVIRMNGAYPCPLSTQRREEARGLALSQGNNWVLSGGAKVALQRWEEELVTLHGHAGKSEGGHLRWMNTGTGKL